MKRFLIVILFSLIFPIQNSSAVSPSLDETMEFLINGSDESFIGWGYEDSEMAIRLLNNGIKLLNGRFSTTVLHIWHKERDRSFQTENWAKLQHVLKSNKLTAEKGLKVLP